MEVRAGAGRRDAIDVARVLALAVVVVGHLTLAVIDRHDGEVRGANLLALRPSWGWVAAAAPMPVFFAAAGWANATATPATSASRLRVLVGLGAVVVTVWSIAAAAALVVTGESGVVGDGARIATQPLWFLAAYLPFAAFGAVLTRLATSRPIAAVGAALASLAALDIARFGFGAPDWIGWPGFFVAWVTPWLAGAWWRGRAERGGFPERRIGAAIAIVAGIAGALLVHFAGYGAGLIDAVPGDRSNTTPPTLYIATVGLAQVGVLLVCAGALDDAGRRWRALWDSAGEAAVGVYLWHLSALALCAVPISLGLPVPERLTAAWWLTRPVWWAAVVALAVGFVLATAAVRSRIRSSADAAPDPPTAATVVVGVVIGAAGAAVVGLEGPRTLPLTALSVVLFLGSWLLLGGARGRVRSLSARP